MEKGGHKKEQLFVRLYRDEEAADATEYALVVALVSLGVVASMALFGSNVAGAYDWLRSQLPTFVST